MSRLARFPSRATLALAATATLAIAMPSPSFGDDATAPAPSSQAGESSVPVTSASPLNWWVMPWRARIALRRLASQRQARITRCLIIEHDQFVTYEIHGRRRVGLLGGEDIVLTRFTESRYDAEGRREARSIRGRLARIGDAHRAE